MNKSESITKLAEALSAFQGEVTNPANTADNPFFKSKYAPLNDILKLVRPLLKKQGLSIIQVPGGDGENVTMTTVLLHKSGEFIETEPLTLPSTPVKGKYTAQGAGSAITYGRRYSLSAVLGISSEDDDDGNAETKNGKPEPKKKAPQKKSPETNSNMSTEAQQKAIHAIAGSKGYSKDEVTNLLMGYHNVDSTKKLTKSQASDIITKLQEGE